MAEAYVCDIFGESIGISNRRVASELPTHRQIEVIGQGVCVKISCYFQILDDKNRI